MLALSAKHLECIIIFAIILVVLWSVLPQTPRSRAAQSGGGVKCLAPGSVYHKIKI